MKPHGHTRIRSALSGLRGRLIVALVAAMVLGSIASTWAGVQQSTASLMETSRHHHVKNLVDQITAAAPSTQYPPNQAALEQLRIAAGENSIVLYQEKVSGDGIFASGKRTVPTELQDKMKAGAGRADDPRGRVLTQRVQIDGDPWLVLGTPVMITAPEGQRRPSGIEVYSAHNLDSVQNQVDGLVRGAAERTALVLPVAVVIALLASRGVLRPVARLRRTAERLAAGDLDARTDPAGVDELTQLTRAVNDMAASLQESMDSMVRMEQDARRFAADVSHELRTPLTTLTAAAEVLQGVLSDQDAAGTANEDARESAQLAVIETRRLVQLVEDIMEIARFDVDAAAVRWEEIELATVVRNCVRARGWSEDVVIVAPAAEAVHDDGAYLVRADRRRIDVVVANLIGNALRHGAAPVRVVLTATVMGTSVRVTDSGPGIAEHVLPHIFSRFYKADASRARTPGSGLGLAIARENARLHGGTLTASNDSAGGAVFTLWLPTDGAPSEGGNEEGEQG